MTITPSSSAKQAREALAARLKDLRQDSGLSARRLAAATGQHFTRVSKIEHGVQSPTDKDIRDWCHACKAEEQIEDLIATARAVESAYVEFRRQARAGMKRVLGPHTLALYEQTILFRIYEHNVIPGLLQTAEYAAAMLSFWIQFLDTENDLDAAVASRMERQRVIYERDKQFVIVLEEQALRTWFGTAETQAGQLDRLLAVMSLPTMSLGIIPMMTERTAVGSAGFWIFDSSLVALETPTASIEVTRPHEIALYAQMFGHLKSAAVYGREARALIRKSLNDLNRRNLSQLCGLCTFLALTVTGMKQVDTASLGLPAVKSTMTGTGPSAHDGIIVDNLRREFGNRWDIAAITGGYRAILRAPGSHTPVVLYGRTPAELAESIRIAEVSL